MRRLLAVLSLILAFACPWTAAAQDTATLVADRVEIRTDSVLVAEGGVEVFYRGARLTAERITYDSAGDRLTITGPIVLTDGGTTTLYADAANLSADLKDGILSSARLVLSQQLQLAAVEIARVGGRYTELDRVVASSCQVCAQNPVPLWSIRARRVIHDQQERQVYFEGAQFRVLDVPVAYIPRLRFPDPTLTRATGFLFPTVRSTSQLGTGLKIPYFVTLGQSADVTLRPYLSARTTTLELRYRQAFRTGAIEFAGAVTRDDLLPDETRFYLFGSGSFDLPRDFKLSFGLEATSDDSYLLDYGYSDKDRLESSLALTRFRRDEAFSARLLNFRSLREAEVDSTLPTLVGSFAYERRFTPGALGGIASLGVDALATYRTSSLEMLGRDVARVSTRLGWERTDIFAPGFETTTALRLGADFYGIGDDTTYDASRVRLTPEASVTLRWPFERTTAQGARELLEPVVALGWSDEDTGNVPNEDSTLTEFDEGNLLSMSRFPGADRHEDGLRLAVGLGWTHIDPRGWSLGVTVGRVLREDPVTGFSGGSGLDGQSSDWLAALYFDLPMSLGFSVRALLDDDLSVTKGDLRLTYTDTRFDLGTGLLLLEAAPAEDRPERVAEWTVDAGWRINANWTGRTDWRYDLQQDRATRAGLGLRYANECVAFDLSLSRRFTSSTSVRPTTDFGLSVELLGFGTGGEGGVARRRCVSY